MDANKQVLNPPEVVVVPPTTETPSPEVVNQAESTSQPEETTDAQEQPTPPVPAVNLDVDEYGVPWKNRAMEWQRKSTELAEKLPQLIEEKLSKFQQPQQQTYTYEQLEAYKLQNSSDSNIVAWAAGEQRKLQMAENEKLFERVVGQREQKIQAEQSKLRSLEYVQQSYPEAFIKDNNGRVVNWNLEHPLYREIDTLMRNTPELANNPNGLSAAADIAYGRYMRNQAANVQQTNLHLKQQVKVLQKGQLAEGGGKRSVPTSTPSQNAIEQVKKSGTIRDASTAIGMLLKARGILQEE